MADTNYQMLPGRKWLEAIPAPTLTASPAPGLAIASATVAVGFLLFTGCSTTSSTASNQGKGMSASATPCMAVLYKFTAPDVPALGPAEEPVKPRKGPETPQPAGLPGNGLAEHPMLYIGEGYNKMFLINNGKIIWTYQTDGGNEYDDVWMLSNGNILFSRMQYVAEVTPQKKVVWRYDAPTNTEIHCCQPIGMDKVLFIENGLPPVLKMMNIQTGKVLVRHELPFLLPPNRKNVHPEFRRVRYTAQGTYLCPFLNMHEVIEYDKNFHEVWSFGTNDVPAGMKFSPWTAVRLKNGDTLITDESGDATLEVNHDRKIVWMLKNDDLPEAWQFRSAPQSSTRLANGDTILCSRGRRDEGPQLVEVTPDKKVVWVLEDWKDLGPATAVQILDDPGYPEIPGQSEH
ncbi:MAG TPA: hypothetical protein VMH30_06450 [Verrucomicrobiae bacterium]|nr:hypothetical protein [Verrucomicrobiae bacterium]